MKPIVFALILVNTSAAIQAQSPSSATSPVRPGLEVFLSDVPAPIRGKRIGLITNHAGIDRVAGRQSISWPHTLT